jgi:Alcohol dehydrogenase GroES-like domain
MAAARQMLPTGGRRDPEPSQAALPHLTLRAAQILGNEFAGQVEAIGPAVTSFAVGDRVFGYDDSSCGAHAQYLTIGEDASLARIPAKLTYAQAANGAHVVTDDRRRFLASTPTAPGGP